MKQLFLQFIIILHLILFCSEYTVAQPPNDLCANAQLINDDGACVGGTTALALDNISGLIGCQLLGSGDVWYKFVATNPIFSASLTAGPLFGSIEFLLIDFGASPCVGTGTIIHSACGPSPLNVTTSALLIPGNTYYMVVSNGLGGILGGFNICPLTNPIPANAIHVDGVNDFIDCGNHPSLDLTEEVTVEAWVRATNASLQGRVVYNGGGFSQMGYSLHFTATNNLRAEVQGPGGNLAVDNVMPTPLLWHHIAFSYSNSKDSIWVYIDGALVSQTFCGVGSLGLFPGNLTIGGIAAGGTNGCFEGAIDEVRIWNRALCHSEIAARKNCQPSTADPGLAAYYNFNQGIAAGSNPTVTIALDGVNLSHGTLNNFALNGLTSNWIDGSANGVGGVCPAIALPETNIYGNSFEIFTGDITPATTDDTDFGTTPIGTPVTNTFSIENPSPDNLTINAINLTGTGASDFLVGGISLPIVIPPFGGGIFTITFSPSVTGTSTAKVEIANDDCNENPYIFDIQGIAAAGPGTGLAFDGVNDHVNIGTSITELQGSSTATMEAWIRSDFQGSFDKVVATVYGDLRLQVENGGRAKVAVRNGVDQLVGTAGLGSIPVGTGTWVHFAVVYDGTQIGNSNILKCYLNGAPLGLAYSGTTPTTIEPSPANFVVLGAMSDISCPQCFWDGAMDEVRIWCVARTQTEIQASMTCELDGTEAGLVAYYNFNQGIADGNNTAIGGLFDSSPNGYHGILNNFTKNGIGSNFTDVTVNGVLNTPCGLPNPSIALEGNAVSISDGSTTPNAADDTDFGTIANGSSAVHVFTIDNFLGGANLIVNNITLTGLNPTEYSIGGISFPTIISPGTSGTFTVTFAPSIVGTFSAVVNVDNNGMCGDYDFVVQGISSPAVSCNLVTNSPICAGDTLFLTENSGTGISWAWSGPNGFISTVPSPFIPSTTSANAGTYTVTVTDGGGSTAVCNATVVVNSLNTSTTVVPITCNGAADGAATVTVSSGTAPFSFVWSTGETTSTITGLAAGTYTVTVTDNGGCERINNVTLVAPAPLITSMTQVNVSCFGGNNGSATVSLLGGTAPYTFSWSASAGSQTTSTATGLIAGIHTVVIQDANLCTASSSVTITSNPPLIVSFTIANILCFGDSSGAITTSPLGGALPYMFSWSNGETTPTITGLSAAGNPYFVTITDAAGCFISDSVVLFQPPAIPTPNISALDTMVCEGEDIQLFTSTAANAYHWSGPAGFISNQQNPVIFTADLSNDGLYTLQVEDASGCLSPDTSIYIYVNSEPYLGLTIGGGPDVCIGDQIMIESFSHSCDSFLWIGPVQTQAGVAGTNYTLVNPTDPNYVTGIWTLQGMDTTTGCISISNPIFINLITPPPFPNPTSDSPVCVGDNANLSVPNVVGATISWYTDSLKSNLIGFGANFVLPNVTTDTTIYVEYVLGSCFSGLGSVTINVTPTVTPDAPANFAVCEGNSINLFTTTIASVYQWSGPNGFSSNAQNPVIPAATLADAGTYTLSVIDTNGCLSPDTTVVVTINTNPVAPASGSNSPVCFGNDLQIFHASGCNQTRWIAPTSAIFVTNTDTLTISAGQTEYVSGTWQIICEDTITGCISIPVLVNATINSPIPKVNASNDGPVCAGEDVTLSIPLIANATYTWFADSLRTIIVGTGANLLVSNMTQDSTFYVEINVLGCIDTSSTFVTVFPTPITPSVPANFAVCTGDSILLGTSTLAAAYQWTMPSGATLNAQNFAIFPATPSNAGLYILNIIDANGCPSLDTSVFVTINTAPATPAISSAPVCFGRPLVLVANGGCSVVEWTGPSAIAFLDSDTLNVPSTAPNYVNNGNWTVRCVDTTTGCFSPMSPVHIATINAVVNVPIISNNSPVCVGGTVQLSAPLIANATYNWYAADSVTLIAVGNSVSIPNILSNTSFVLEFGINGCTDMEPTFVSVFPPSPAPLVPDTIKVCPSDTIFLNTPTFATAYNWTGPNGFASTLQNPTIYFASSANAGTYTLSTLDVNGCPTPDTTVEVVIHAVPLPPVISSPNNTVCYDDTLFLNSSATCGQLWWEGPTGVPFLGTTNINVTNLSSDFMTGNWMVTCIDTFTGCQSTSAPFAVTINPMPPAPPITSNSPVCAGDSISLNMALIVGATYQWLDNSNNVIGTTPSISVLATNSTTFYGQATVNGCTSMDSIAVVVNPIPPTPDAFTNTNPVCEGGFLQCSTYTVAPVYNWTGPNGFSSNMQMPFITPATLSNSGTYFLNIIDFNGCQSLDSFVNITVTPIPSQPTIIGTNSICSGDTIFLETQACQRLRWLPPFTAPIIVVGDSSLVIPPGDPNYATAPWQVICEDTLTGCTSIPSNPFFVTVNPFPSPPSVSNDGPVCVNESVTLNVIPQPTSSYIWYADSLLTDTLGFGTTVIVDSISADSTFYVQIINASGCASIGSTTVILSPAPALPIAAVVDSVVCEGEDVFLQELGGGIAFLWTGPNGYMSTSQNPIINTATLADAGTYTVFVTNTSGCVSPGASVNVYVNVPAAPPTISGGSNICFGDTIILTSTIVCDSTRWFGSMGSLQGVGAQLVIPSSAAQYGNGDWTLMCFDTITGCFSTSNTIFVNLLPIPATPVINHNGSACFGDSIVLSTPIVLGAVNNWYADSLATIFLGTGNSIAVGSIVADSTYYLLQTVNGCDAPIASTTVFVLPISPAPIVPADFAVCIGGTLNLSTTTIATSYLWTHPNGFTSTAQNPSISPVTITDAGTYTLSTIDLNGCPTPDTTITITVNPLPPTPIIFANDPTCEGDTMSFGSNIPPNAFVQWISPSNDTIPGLFNMYIPATDINYLAGTWTVIFTDTITRCKISGDTVLNIDIAPTGTASTSSPVCVGDSVVLSAPTIAGVSTYLWYRVDSTQIGTGQTITVSNIISDTVFGLVVVTTAGCDYLIDSVFVNVLPQSPAPPIQVDSLVCVGEPIQFTTAPALAYNWVGSNGFTSTAQNPLIPAAALTDAGLYTLNVTDINGCTSLDSSVNIIVNTPPTAPVASAPALICSGDTLFLSSNANTCDTAYWVGGNGTIIIGGANIAIPPSSPYYIGGNWQVFCVDTLAGCETGSNIINVVINPLPIAIAVNNGPICINETVQLTANFVANATYAWYSDTSLTNIIGTTQVVLIDSIAADTTFYLVITDLNGCSSNTAITNVVVQTPAPAPNVGGPITVCEGDDFTLTSFAFTFGYNWIGPNGFVSNQANPVVQNATLADSGLYTLTILGFNGCPSEDTTIHVTVDSLPDAPVITGFIYLCEGDTLFLNADSTTSQCDLVQWVGPNGQAMAIVGSNIAIAPGDTNYVGGFWQVQCVDTTTGCFSSSNLSLVIIAPTPLDTQATFNSGPVCIGSSVALSTGSAGSLMNYTWYADSTLTNISGTGQNVTVNGIVSDTTFYLVITNAGGCASNPIPTPVFVLAPANPPSIPADTQYCVGEAISLSTTTVATTYVWSSPNGFVSNQQNPIVTLAATVVDSGLYILYTIDSAGCRSADTSLHIAVNPLPPTPSIIQNSPLCDGDTLILTASTSCGNSQWIGPNGSANPLFTTGSTLVVLPTDANYQNSNWYMICTDTFTGCSAMSDTVTVTINPSPIIASITTSGAVCVGDSVSLVTTVVGTNAVIYVWYADAALATPIATGGNPTIPNVTANATYYVQVTDVVTGCNTLDSIAIVLNPAPAAPTLIQSTILCEGDSIILTTPTLASGYNWSGPNGFASSLQNPIPFIGTTLDSGIYNLFVIDTNGCASPIATTLVSVNAAPPIPLVANNSPLCTGGVLTLSASTVAGATYEWFHLPNNTSVGFGQNLTLGNLTLADTGYYYVVVTTNGCSASSDSTLVTIYTNSSAVASAGLDITLCGLDTFSLNAVSVGQPLIGNWTTSSGAIILNPNANNSFVANLAVGQNVFYWTLSTANCPAFSTDTMIITVAPPTTDIANAGVNQNLCGVTTTALSATMPNISTGNWVQSATQANQGVIITDSLNPNTSISGLQVGGTYTFVWQLTNGVCGIHSTDTVLITINAMPSGTAFAGVDIVTCSQGVITLAATSPTIGTGLWTTNSSAIIINPNQNNTIVTNLPQGTTMFVWTLSNGVCLDYASDTMFVTVGGANPVANADSFAVIPGNTPIIIDVLPNDNLTSNWTINLNTPISSGQITNLNTGQFQLDLQGVTTNQSFIYELCNPACPNNCDTAIVVLTLQQTLPCVTPNIFTPNGDGVNDFFEIPCLDILLRTKLMIFNRWGDLVYETDSYNNQWDGTHNGQPLPDGTYFFIMKIENQDEIQNSIELRR